MWHVLELHISNWPPAHKHTLRDGELKHIRSSKDTYWIGSAAEENTGVGGMLYEVTNIWNDKFQIFWFIYEKSGGLWPHVDSVWVKEKVLFYFTLFLEYFSTLDFDVNCIKGIAIQKNKILFHLLMSFLVQKTKKRYFEEFR